MARLSRLAVARWELEPDRSALAVPVFGPGGRVAAAIEVRVDDPAAGPPVVRPALVIAGRSLSRELAATHEMTGRGPGLRPHPGGEIPPGRFPAGRSSPAVSTRVLGLPCAPAPSRSFAPRRPHGR